MAELEFIHGYEAGRRFPLTKDKCELGRHPDCDVVLDIGAVSRKHAQILRRNGRFYLEDLKSRNGTFLNGQPIHGQRELHDLDAVRICEVLMTFHGGPKRPAGEVNSGDSYPPMLLDDDELTASSTIISRLDISSGSSGVRMAVNPQIKLEALLEISQNLSKAISLDEVLPKVLDSLFKVFIQADRGFIVLRDEDDGRLIPKAARHRRPNVDETIRISRTILNRVIDSKQAMLSADAASDDRFELSQSITDFRIRSMICAPMIDSAGEVLGVIQLDTLDQRNRFQEEDLEVLASVASQASIAVQNAQLHEAALRQRAVQRDLELARRVQRSLLPIAAPRVAGYQFFDFYEPASEVGGDFFDYIELPDGRWSAILADVSGKGVAAALVMAKLSGEVRFHLASEPTPAAAMSRINQAFVRNGWEDRFVTMILSVLDPVANRVTFVNAGHMPPFVRHSDGTVEQLGDDVAGVPLGVADDFPFQQTVCEIRPGDTFVTFTDGVSEAMNSGGQLFGMERIRECLAHECPRGTDSSADLGIGSSGLAVASAAAAVETNCAASWGRTILEAVREFAAGRAQSDDICLFCFGRGTE
jgi:sigma-B regulation protein RsbU (phosphoserine phosphatase)